MKTKTIFYLTVLTALLLQACNLPSAASTPDPQNDPLIAAQMTITAMSEQNPPTETLPTFTSVPALSPTPEFTPTPAFTPTPSFAYVTLSEATNCRIGPAVNYDLVDTFLVGQTIEVVGKHPFDNYWYVRSPNNPNVYCWMWGAYATGANLGNVPVMTPPPSPTPAPTSTLSPLIISTLVIKPVFTASFVNYGQCVNWWTRFNITNTGVMTVKSIAISLKDTVTNEIREASTDGFQDANACALSAPVQSLSTGQSTTVVGPSFSANPAGHKVNATITLCAEKGLGGACSSTSFQFTP